MKLDRLINILLILVDKKKITGRELADRFNVTVRTIQRDITTLSSMGIPIYSDSGVNGGYRMLDTYKLDKSFLKLDEADLLQGVINSLVKVVPSNSIKSIQHKLKVSLPQKDTTVQSYNIQIDSWVENKNVQNKLKDFSLAIESNSLVEIYYYDLNNIKSSRDIEPYALVLKQSSWYLHAYCQLRSGFRLFKLNRITSYEILSLKFTKDQDYQPWQYSDVGIETSRVVLHFAKSLHGKLLDYFDDSELEHYDTYIKVEVNYPDDEWLYSWLLSYVPYVKVIKPEYVRKKLLHKLQEGINTLLNE